MLITVVAVVAVLAVVLPLTIARSGTSIPSTVAAGAPSFGASSGKGDEVGGDASTTSTPIATTTLATTATGLSTVGSGDSGIIESTSPGTPRSVAIIGDSITVLATSDIERALGRYNPYIDAVIGSTMAEHLSNIEQIESAGPPRDWVIELGTNDALRKNANWASDFANEVTALQSQPCVVFLTVNPELGPISRGINQAIAQAMASHPNFHSIDWGDIEFRRNRWLSADGVHPTKSGDAELARLEGTATLACQAG